MNLDPAFIQRNVESLSVIGGVYDLLALVVEHDHREILHRFRLDTSAKSAVELIAEATQPPLIKHNHTKETQCPNSPAQP